MRHFDVAGPAHDEDEECHVLPWLALHGHAALAEQLHAVHVRMATDWVAVRAGLAEVAAGSWASDTAAATLARRDAFARLYEAHIDAEETQAYPPAAAAFDATACEAIGREMAARRRVTQA